MIGSANQGWVIPRQLPLQAGHVGSAETHATYKSTYSWHKLGGYRKLVLCGEYESIRKHMNEEGQ